MRYLDEYHDPAVFHSWLRAIRSVTTRPWTLMEICGGQTHSILKHAIDALLPPEITLVHGPGCPVCVTPVELLDKAIELATRPDVILCSFGDMLRVPGTRTNLLAVKAEGGDVRLVHSPLDCLVLAEQNPRKTVVFFAVGFETTAPANAMAAWQARGKGLTNFALLVSHVLVAPAMAAILDSPANLVQGFLAAGHVCSVVGCGEQAELAERYSIPIVVTGFEPVDLLDGIYHCIQMLESGQAGLKNRYARAVRDGGNERALGLMAEVFEVTDRHWRGIGPIPRSGFRLRPEDRDLDAEIRFDLAPPSLLEAQRCLSGLILQGRIKPRECPDFDNRCTPQSPLGATMVSSEGACAASYHYGRLEAAAS
jgi:hydrogenase expression/formation protein HypD